MCLTFEDGKDKSGGRVGVMDELSDINGDFAKEALGGLASVDEVMRLREYVSECSLFCHRHRRCDAPHSGNDIDNLQCFLLWP